MVKVSVYCLAYNHEKYIKDTLEGFVNQIVNFEYEVFVHDDASTDHTAEIIAEYAKLYPDIIKPIYQKENQYSKRIPIVKTYIYPRMKGEYIAVCEGDDYWCDPHKLQMQVDFLDAHLDYSACVHNTKQINCRNGKESYINKLQHCCDLKLQDIISHGNSQFQISSLMYRKEYFIRPKEFYLKSVGDYPLSVYLILNGPIYYFSDVMSVYRLYTENSWTSKMELSGNQIEKKEKHNQEIKEFLNNVNNYTKGKYESIIIDTQKKNEFKLLCVRGEEKRAILEYKDVFFKLSIGNKVKILIKAYLPMVYHFHKKLRGLNNAE